MIKIENTERKCIGLYLLVTFILIECGAEQ
jgi:hypothetical protein